MITRSKFESVITETDICVSKLTNIGSDNSLLLGQRQAIIWTNVGILIIGFLGTNFSEILIQIQTFVWKMAEILVSAFMC